MNKADWVNAPAWSKWYTEDKYRISYWEGEPFWDDDRRSYRHGESYGLNRRQWVPSKGVTVGYIEQRPTRRAYGSDLPDE